MRAFMSDAKGRRTTKAPAAGAAGAFGEAGITHDESSLKNPITVRAPSS